MSKDYVKEIVMTNAGVYYRRLAREKGADTAKKLLHSLMDQVATNGSKKPGAKKRPRVNSKLKAFMEKSSLSREDMAKKLGVSEASIQQWLLGKYAPGKANLDKIQQLLNEPVPKQTEGAQRDKKLCQKLRQYMIDSEKTQAEVAKKLGVVQGTISAWSRGLRPIPEDMEQKIQQLVS